MFIVMLKNSSGPARTLINGKAYKVPDDVPKAEADSLIKTEAAQKIADDEIMNERGELRARYAPPSTERRAE